MPDISLPEIRRFTRDELSQYNGQNGAPAYIACHGWVYDVSRSYHWRNGRHQVRHHAGANLTRALDEAPHTIDMLLRMPVVGILVE